MDISINESQDNITLDGVKYVPESQTISVKEIERVLKNLDEFSDNKLQMIVDCFRELETAKDDESDDGDVVEQKHHIYRKRDMKIYSSENFKKFDSEGNVYWKKGRYQKSKWTIHDAMNVRSRMNNNTTEGVSNSVVDELVKKTGLTGDIIRIMMYNIEFGELSHWIDNWVAQYSYSKPKTVPVVNNPQKRREMSGLL